MVVWRKGVSQLCHARKMQIHTMYTVGIQLQIHIPCVRMCENIQKYKMVCTRWNDNAMVPVTCLYAIKYRASEHERTMVMNQYDNAGRPNTLIHVA